MSSKSKTRSSPSRLAELEARIREKQRRAMLRYTTYLWSLPDYPAPAMRELLRYPEIPGTLKITIREKLQSLGEPLEIQPDDERILYPDLGEIPFDILKELYVSGCVVEGFDFEKYYKNWIGGNVG